MRNIEESAELNHKTKCVKKYSSEYFLDIKFALQSVAINGHPHWHRIRMGNGLRYRIHDLPSNIKIIAACRELFLVIEELALPTQITTNDFVNFDFSY